MKFKKGDIISRNYTNVNILSRTFIAFVMEEYSYKLEMPIMLLNSPTEHEIYYSENLCDLLTNIFRESL